MFIWIWVVASRWDYWKLGVSRKIFGLKVWCLAENIRLGIRKSLENIWFEIRIILDISGIINLWVVVAFGRRLPIFCDNLYHSH